MATTIPAGGQIPVEPAKLPPATPAEAAELQQMIADNRWHQWQYTARCLYSKNPDGTDKLVTITGVDVDMLNARRKNVFGSWPMPGEYVSGQWPPTKPANCVTVIQYPA